MSLLFQHQDRTGLLIKEIRRQLPATLDLCLPITVDILAFCLTTLNNRVRHDRLVFIGFFGLLRCSEFTCPTSSFIPVGYPCVSDLYMLDHNTIYFIKQNALNEKL